VPKNQSMVLRVDEFQFMLQTCKISFLQKPSDAQEMIHTKCM